MKKLLFFCFLLSTLGLFAQNTIKDANAVSRNAKNFHAITISDGIDLYLSQGNEEAVAISASDKDYLDRIQVEVIEGILHISLLEKKSYLNINWGNKKLKAYVSFTRLDKINASGGSDVLVDKQVDVPALSLELSGGSDFKGKVLTTTFRLSVSGGSDAHVSGKSENTTLEASGGSDIQAYDFITGNCKVTASGGSDVHISVNKELSGMASGGSDIYYKGSGSSSATKNGGSGVKKVN